MRTSWRSWSAAAVFAAALPAQSAVLDQVMLLERLIDLDWLWQPPLPGERCVQFSSYDRASQRGPGDPAAWYANNDRGQYLRVVERDGGKEFVMAEVQGPGCIARLWSANPQGTLHFDLDGARVWSVDFAALCSGKVKGVPEPIAGMHARGGNCYLPIPFGRSLVLSCTSGECYYAVDVVQWPAGTRVDPFAPARLATLGAGERMVTATARIGPYNTEIWVPTQKQQVAPGQVVRKLDVLLPSSLPRADQIEIMRHCLLVVRCGDEETVRVPLADFFAVGAAGNAFVGRCLALSDRKATCAFPMPMPKGGSIEIVVEADYGDDPWPQSKVPLIDRAWTEPLADTDPLLFRASYQLAKGTPTRPFSDHRVLDARGTGRFVGCSLLVRNPSRVWWGEGDEKFTVDGEAFPSWFGTGTEDYFGYAWCDATPFAALFHAQVECQGPMNFGFTQLHRTHVLDAVPFRQSFRFDLERWHWVETIAIDYATVAYWYGAPGATSGLPPVPAAEDRWLDNLSRVPMLVVDGALEAENLKVLSCSRGEADRQSTWFVEKTFSGDAQLWWRGGQVGDVLVLGVPVPDAGRYRVTLANGQSDDYGIVKFSLAGLELGQPFDGYSPMVCSSGAREVGVVQLMAGLANLRIEIVGRNEKAKPQFMLGLDYVKLEKLP